MKKKKQKQKNMLHHKNLSVYKRDFYSHVFAHPVRHIYIYSLHTDIQYITKMS